MERSDSADTLMTTVSRHHFGDEMDEPAFSISIIENMKEDYGLFVWPCSVVLAEYVWQQRLRFSGAGVVEVLGAGTSLPGLVAAKVGADVTLTDDSSRLEVLDNMKRVLDLNKLECNCVKLLDAFSFMPSHKASGLSGNLQLAEIVLDSQRAEIPVLH
ncbi:hypothetical protein GBA52_025296 [Prunus armeniaca]|nr:hypothetical protein GBA52_025296 [Prunus armeniaca]